ncbi:MAG: peptidoglycan-binding protein [Patescibacteria group bacterium]|nr:peptidoglycan-binding protein [Patescibacteria group bacterium]MDE2438668.1 peptidoglycan-binding protein [Patescibacteria group bacterium]
MNIHLRSISKYSIGFFIIGIVACSLVFAEDMVAPQLSRVTITGSIAIKLYSDGAFITWESNRPERYILSYGDTLAYGQTETSPLLVTRHEAILRNLHSATVYHFRITLEDGYNQGISRDYSFTTLAQGVALLPPIGLERFLLYGNRGEDVLRLQQFLTRENLYTGPITGFYNQDTKIAVEQFQCRERIVCGNSFYGYGEVLRNTFHAINALLGA